MVCLTCSGCPTKGTHPRRSKVLATTIQRQLDLEGRRLNLTLRLRTNGSVGLEFNFHWDTPNTESAANALRADIGALKSLALKIALDVYGAEPTSL